MSTTKISDRETTVEDENLALRPCIQNNLVQARVKLKLTLSLVVSTAEPLTICKIQTLLHRKEKLCFLNTKSDTVSPKIMVPK